MKKIARYLFLLLFTISCLNCIPVMVGGLMVAKSNKTKHEKQVWITEFNNNNLEREKAGLPPLDTCIAKYQFDPGWEEADDSCKEKIEAYKRGEIDECGRKIEKK